MRANLVRLSAVAVAMAGCVFNASATVTYLIGDGGLETVNIDMAGGYDGSALAGGISIQQQPAPTPATSYITVCTDVGDTLYLGRDYVYNSPAPFSNQSGNNPLWGLGTTGAAQAQSAAAAIQNAAYIFNTYGQLSAASGLGGNNDLKTAIQLAVWYDLYNTVADGSVSGNTTVKNGAATGSRFSFSGVDSGVSTYLNSFNLASLNGSYGYSGSILIPVTLTPSQVADNNDEQPQELLVGSGSSIIQQLGSSSPVPEPTTVFAAALLLLPLGASAIRILRKSKGN